MNPFDFSNDKPSIRELIPTGTLLLVRMTYTPGGADLTGTAADKLTRALTPSKPPKDTKYLKAEFTVLRGPYKGRKFWENMTFEGGELDEKKRSKAGMITRSKVRTMIDASRGLSSKDESPAAQAQRILANGFLDFQNMTFACKAGFEKGKDGYGDKNRLGDVLTVDHKDYPKSEADFDNVTVPTSAPVAALPAPSWGAPAPAAAPVALAATPAEVAQVAPPLAPAAATTVAAPATAPPPAATPANPALPGWMTGNA